MIDQQAFLAKTRLFNLPYALIRLSARWGKNFVKEWDGNDFAVTIDAQHVQLEIEVTVYDGRYGPVSAIYSFDGEIVDGDYARPMAFLEFCEKQMERIYE